MTTLTVIGRCGAHPVPGGAGRGVLLQGGTAAVLLGCGSGVAARLAYHLPAGEPGAVILPDLRPDHTCDLWTIGSAAAADTVAGRRRGLLPVYALGAPAADWAALQRPGVLDVRRFAPGDRFPVAGWTLGFAALDHAWPGAALRAELGGAAVALVGCGGAPEAARALCAGVDLLIVDVGGPQTGDEGLDGGMSAAAAGALAAEAGAAALLLTHLDPDDDPAALEAAARTRFPGARLALEGRTYPL